MFSFILGVTGVILYLPAVYIQVLAVFRPHDQKTKDLLVGKGCDYHDRSYFGFCRGSGWADLFIQLPLVIGGSIGILFSRSLWVYLIWFAGACITLYIHLILVFLEGRHIWTKWGKLAFFTYGWGLWVYWALTVAIYCLYSVLTAPFLFTELP